MKLRKIKPILIVIAIGFALNLYVHRKELVNSYIVYGDIAFHYIFNYLLDNSLFPRDIFLQTLIESKFSWDLIPLATPLLPISLVLIKIFSLSKALALHSIFYSIIASLFVFKIGRFLKNDREALKLVLIFLIYTITMDSFCGGCVRGIGFILTSAIYYCLYREYKWQTIILIPLTFVFYPPILPMVLIASCLGVYNKKNKYIRGRFRIIAYTFLFIISIVVLLKAFYHFNQVIMPFLQDIMQWKTDNFLEVSKNTIMPLPVRFVLDYIFNFDEHTPVFSYFTIAMITAIVAVLFKRRKALHLMLADKKFILAAFLAFIILLPLHGAIASRQLIFSLPLFLAIIFWRVVGIRFFQMKRKLLVGLLLVGLLIGFYNFENGLLHLGRFKSCFKYISAQPKDILVAAHPLAADFIPFFTKRSVFYSYFWDDQKGFLSNEIRKVLQTRRERLLKALYTSSESELLSFINQYRITHFVIVDHYYSEDYLNNFDYFQGGDKKLSEEISKIVNVAKNKQPRFLLLDMGRSHGRDFGKGIYVLDCQKIITDYSRK